MPSTISIIMPVYNTVKYLDTCIGSVLAQSFQNWEMVIVDDGSTDGSATLCKRYADKDARIHLLCQSNTGPAGAVKNGICHAQGQYFMFLDSDDWIETDYCQRMLDTAQQQECDVVVCGYVKDSQGGSTIRVPGFAAAPGKYDRQAIEKEIFPKLLSLGRAGTFWIQPSRCCKIFRRETIIQNLDYLRTDFRRGEDFLIVFSALFICGSLYLLPDFTPYHYRTRIESITQAYDPRFLGDLLRGIEAQRTILQHYGWEDGFANQLDQEMLNCVLIAAREAVLHRSTLGTLEAKRCVKHMVADIQLPPNMLLEDIPPYERLMKRLMLHHRSGSVWAMLSIWQTITKIRTKRL